MPEISESGIIELLSERPLGTREIADHFGADDRIVIELVDGLVRGGWITAKYVVRRLPEHLKTSRPTVAT